jgi:hypothetical protein
MSSQFIIVISELGVFQDALLFVALATLDLLVINRIHWQLDLAGTISLALYLFVAFLRSIAHFLGYFMLQYLTYALSMCQTMLWVAIFLFVFEFSKIWVVLRASNH